jgi:hypothetical protein
MWRTYRSRQERRQCNSSDCDGDYTGQTRRMASTSPRSLVPRISETSQCPLQQGTTHFITHTRALTMMPLPAVRAAATMLAPPAGSPADTPTLPSPSEPVGSLGLKMTGWRGLSSRPLSFWPLLLLVVVVVSSEPAGAPATAREAPLSSPRVSAGVRDSAGERC